MRKNRWEYGELIQRHRQMRKKKWKEIRDKQDFYNIWNYWEKWERRIKQVRFTISIFMQKHKKCISSFPFTITMPYQSQQPNSCEAFRVLPFRILVRGREVQTERQTKWAKWALLTRSKDHDSILTDDDAKRGVIRNVNSIEFIKLNTLKQKYSATICKIILIKHSETKRNETTIQTNEQKKNKRTKEQIEQREQINSTKRETDRSFNTSPRLLEIESHFECSRSAGNDRIRKKSKCETTFLSCTV